MKRGLGSAKRAKSNSKKESAVVAAEESGSPGHSVEPAAPVERDPSMEAKVAEIRERIERSVGQAVLMMVHSPRYRHQTLADLEHLLLEPLLSDRLTIAYGRRDGEDGTAPSPIGFAIWASVSKDVNARLEEHVRGGAFPLRLAAADWTGGDLLWLIDIVAVNQEAASAVFLNFRTIAGDRPVHIHPIIATLIDRELVEKFARKPEDVE